MVMTLISTPHLQQRKQGFKWVPSKKPEMDLNEFLQQMEILKDNSQAEVSQVGARRNWKLSLNYAFRLQQFGKLW